MDEVEASTDERKVVVDSTTNGIVDDVIPPHAFDLTNESLRNAYMSCIRSHIEELTSMREIHRKELGIKDEDILRLEKEIKEIKERETLTQSYLIQNNKQLKSQFGTAMMSNGETISKMKEQFETAMQAAQQELNTLIQQQEDERKYNEESVELYWQNLQTLNDLHEKEIDDKDQKITQLQNSIDQLHIEYNLKLQSVSLESDTKLRSKENEINDYSNKLLELERLFNLEIVSIKFFVQENIDVIRTNFPVSNGDVQVERAISIDIDELKTIVLRAVENFERQNLVTLYQLEQDYEFKLREISHCIEEIRLKYVITFFCQFLPFLPILANYAIC